MVPGEVQISSKNFIGHLYREFISGFDPCRAAGAGTGGTARHGKNPCRAGKKNFKSVPCREKNFKIRAVPCRAGKIFLKPVPCRAVPGKNRAGTEILNYLIVKILLK